MKMRERIEQKLKQDGVVCATWFWRNYMPSGRNRISEMRQEGWQIVTEPCNRHVHESATIQYRLLAPAGQTKLDV